MKNSTLKRLVSGVLISAMALSGSAALAVDENTTIEDLIIESDLIDGPVMVFPDSVTKTTRATRKSASYPNYAKATVKNRGRVHNVTAGWIYSGNGILHIDWNKKNNSNLMYYEVELSYSKKFARSKSEYFTVASNSATLDSDNSYIFNTSKHKTYYIRVRAQYTDGKRGTWSETLKLVVNKKSMIPASGVDE